MVESTLSLSKRGGVSPLLLHHFREPVNGFTHLAGAILSIPALITLLILTAISPSVGPDDDSTGRFAT